VSSLLFAGDHRGTRALFVCDRDELRRQALGAFQNVFGSAAAEVFRKPDGTNNAKNARIHIATYQTLGVENENGDANFLTTYYPENYFTHIVIDECHRSAWGRRSQVLTRNGKAVKIGLTATPRQLECKEETVEAKQDSEITANNIRLEGMLRVWVSCRPSAKRLAELCNGAKTVLLRAAPTYPRVAAVVNYAGSWNRILGITEIAAWCHDSPAWR